MTDCRDCVHHDVCDAHGKLILTIGEFCELEYTPYSKWWCKHFTATADVAPRAEVDKLKYTLVGVMHSVDKWLDGDELKQDEVNRAITMREKTLRIVENARAEVAREIFEGIEREITDALKSNYKVLPQIEESEALWNHVNGKINALRGIEYFIEELKEKYTEGGRE